MFDLKDNDDIIQFKKRLSSLRTGHGYTQDTFADKLGDSNRSRVANWESKKSTTLIQLHDLPLVCTLLDTDPNYLLGFSNDISEDNTTIANKLHISPNNVQLLKNNAFIGKFIDAFLTSNEFNDLICNVQRVVVQGFFSESLEKTFSPYALTQLYNAYYNFREEVFPLDMNAVLFSYYVEKKIKWNRDRHTFEEFVNSIIIDKRYYDMLSTNPSFMSKDDSEKYTHVIVEIAKASYNHLNSNTVIELTELKIKNILDKIAKDFIQQEICDFKNCET